MLKALQAVLAVNCREDEEEVVVSSTFFSKCTTSNTDERVFFSAGREHLVGVVALDEELADEAGTT